MVSVSFLLATNVRGEFQMSEGLVELFSSLLGHGKFRVDVHLVRQTVG